MYYKQIKLGKILTKLKKYYTLQIKQKKNGTKKIGLKKDNNHIINYT